MPEIYEIDVKPDPSNSYTRQLVDDVNAGCIVVFVDEWGNERTMEARALCVIAGGIIALLGYQIDGGPGIAPEQLWKRVDKVNSVTVTEIVGAHAVRSVPPQYAENVARLVALAPNTIWDQTRHEASNEDDG